MGSSQEISVAGVEWLRSIWEYYGRKVKFQVRVDDWKNYLDLVDLLRKADPTIVQAWPNNEVVDANGQSALMDVEIKPLGMKLLKDQPREVHRQIKIDGENIDVRSERWASVVGVPVENIIADVKRDLKKLAREGDLAARKGIIMDWRRILRAKRHELPTVLAAKMDREIAKPLVPIVV
jgi:hypothetical protein